MTKKCLVLVTVIAVVVALFSFVTVPASAATLAEVKNDYASYTDGDMGQLSLAKTFAGIESADHVRIKYAWGKGYLCPTGGGEVAQIVYKLDTNGKTTASLNLKMKAHFASRAGYSPDWKEAPVCNVEVSTDGKAYVRATSFAGERVKKTQYTDDQAFRNLPVKEYTANLTSAVKTKNSAAIYVRVSWNVFDYPLYSSIHSIELVAADAGGSSSSGTTSSKPTQSTSKPSSGTTSKTSSTTGTASQPSSQISVSDFNGNSNTQTGGDVTSVPTESQVVSQVEQTENTDSQVNSQQDEKPQEDIVVGADTGNNTDSPAIPGWIWGIVGVLGAAVVVLVLNAVGVLSFKKKQ